MVSISEKGFRRSQSVGARCSFYKFGSAWMNSVMIRAGEHEDDSQKEPSKRHCNKWLRKVLYSRRVRTE